ncbi:hypothetical protein [Vampirovibrio chlorellavorus]|uniref:hypothetical protein n=1 Tax=Vampirovibrio chlorellavorus TaxID=758823 RepID=UPI0026EA9799|nr:hypothetical protein [Vampirovibrio chlorellavorus]
MYPKLLPLLKRFIFVRQGAFNRYYEGKLVSVDADALQIQSYRKDGSPEELWTIALDTITEFSVGGRHLAELALKVSFISSDEMTMNYDGEVLMLEGSATDTVVQPAADEVSE